MATKISELTPLATLSGSDLLEVSEPQGTSPETYLSKSVTAQQIADLAGTAIQQNSQSADYTLVAADAGKHIFHPASDANARTFTIPADASVAFPVGTAVTFVNMTSQVVSIAITSDTMYLAGAGTTGARALAQYGVATAVKITSTSWIISGTGLT